MENPEPTEGEHEQAGTERHDEEDEMRYPRGDDAAQPEEDITES